jgi:hypothetical protein
MDLLDHLEAAILKIQLGFPGALIVLAGYLNILLDSEVVIWTSLTSVVLQATRGTSRLGCMIFSTIVVTSAVSCTYSTIGVH